MTVVTRFAPSPTGYLHIGGLRTALFSYLWAKKNNGSFRLRIEDTDKNRQIMGADKRLIKTLTDLGLKPDGEIVYQSKRALAGIYKKSAEMLLQDGNAYHCFCSAERLASLRKDQATRKQAPGYDGACKKLSRENADARRRNGETATVRLKWPRGNNKVGFKDGIHGRIEFPISTVQDSILIKSDGYPTYHLANVVDDNAMGVTHVIRGEEWLPSAPVHDLLYELLHLKKPEFWHIPLILNPDKSKLSKRQGDMSVESYLEKGYLKEALINYISFLGWNPGGEREIFSIDQLTEEFELKKVNKTGAVFNIAKLNWYNNQYIKCNLATKSNHDIYLAIKSYLPEINQVKAVQVFNMFFERIINLADLKARSEFLWRVPDYQPSLLIFKKSEIKKTLHGLQLATQYIRSYKQEWTAINLELILNDVSKVNSLSNGDVFWPVRVALSGQATSPPPSELLVFLGKQESLKRLAIATDKLAAKS